MQTRVKSCKYCGETTHFSWKCLFKPRLGSKPCSTCDSKTHLSWQCPGDPRREELTRKKLKSGKVSLQWRNARTQWLRSNKSDHAGFYYCYICGTYLTRDTITLDHIKSRSRHPELRLDPTNLAPCCGPCNFAKGSLDLEEFKEISTDRFKVRP